MMKESLWNETLKERFRKVYLAKRRALSEERQKRAAHALLTAFLPLRAQSVLSFSSLPSEIDTSLLNERLAVEGRLILPRCCGKELTLYRVLNPHTQLAPGSFGLLEPDPNLCEEVDPSEIECILVPGLAFDQSFHRLGYGKGYYDRLLIRCPNATAYGVGFTEQKVHSLPQAPHDIPLSDLCLF